MAAGAATPRAVAIDYRTSRSTHFVSDPTAEASTGAPNLRRIFFSRHPPTTDPQQRLVLLRSLRLRPSSTKRSSSFIVRVPHDTVNLRLAPPRLDDLPSLDWRSESPRGRHIGGGWPRAGTSFGGHPRRIASCQHEGAQADG